MTLCVAEDLRDQIDFLGYFLVVSSMHHGEQIEGPIGQVPRPKVRVTDEAHPPYPGPQLDDLFVVHIPYRHTVGSKTQLVVIRHRAYTSDHSTRQQMPQPLLDYNDIYAELIRYRMVRFRGQRESLLCSQYDTSVEFV